MSKTNILLVVLVVLGVYSYTNGKKGTDTASLIQTWLPVAAAGAVYFNVV